MPEPDQYVPFFSRRAAGLLSDPRNAMPTRAIGGVLGGYYAAKDHPEGVLGLLTDIVKGAPQAAVEGIQGAMQEAPGTVYGTNRGEKNTNLALALLGGSGAAGVLPAMRAPQGSLRMINWHGGPNKWAPEPDFPQGRPRRDKIGTGEGAQAYGHGFYSAENRAVGNDYFDTFNDPDNIPLSFKDRPVDEIWNDGIKERWSDVIEGMTEDQVDDFTTVMGSLSQVNNFDDVKHVLSGFTPDQKRMYRTLVEPSLSKPTPNASLYKLDIPDEDVAKYLDWDAPVKGNKSLEALAEKYGVAKTADGGSLYETMKMKLGGLGASETFRKAGIPGLKYYDGMSRGEGKGTRNFVTWDQDVLDRTKVLERNGIGLLDQ